MTAASSYRLSGSVRRCGKAVGLRVVHKESGKHIAWTWFPLEQVRDGCLDACLLIRRLEEFERVFCTEENNLSFAPNQIEEVCT